MGAAAAAQLAVPAAAPKAEVTPKLAASNAMVQFMSGSADLMQMITSAIEAAFQPMRNQLEATIMPMQRAIESLQAEFVARGEFQAGDADDAMEHLALRDFKRASEPDRMQTRATKLRTAARAYNSLVPPHRERCESQGLLRFQDAVLLECVLDQ